MGSGAWASWARGNSWSSQLLGPTSAASCMTYGFGNVEEQFFPAVSKVAQVEIHRKSQCYFAVEVVLLTSIGSQKATEAANGFNRRSWTPCNFQLVDLITLIHEDS